MNTLNLPIVIAFEQTSKHTKDLIKTHTRNAKSYWIWVALAVVMLIVLLRTILNAENPQRMLWSILIAVVPFAIIWYVILRFARKKQTQNKELYGYREMTFDAKKIYVKMPHSETTYNWEGILKMLESKQSYFLYITNIQALIVPKEAFENEIDRANFEMLCQLKIGNSDRTLAALVE